jgi:hypothetical protein
MSEDKRLLKLLEDCAALGESSRELRERYLSILFARFLKLSPEIHKRWAMYGKLCDLLNLHTDEGVSSDALVSALKLMVDRSGALFDVEKEVEGDE